MGHSSVTIAFAKTAVLFTTYYAHTHTVSNFMEKKVPPHLFFHFQSPAFTCGLNSRYNKRNDFFRRDRLWGFPFLLLHGTMPILLIES